MVAHQGACAITLKVVVPTDKPYCDQTTGCTSPTHFQILTAAGEPITFVTPSCATMCGTGTTCQFQVCPGIACIASHGTEFTGTQMVWDGTSYAMSTCGMGTQCYQKSTAPSGHYIARMCGTPGKLDNPDAGFQANCVATGAAVCVDVPFDYPGPTPVVGKLP